MSVTWEIGVAERVVKSATGMRDWLTQRVASVRVSPSLFNVTGFFHSLGALFRIEMGVVKVLGHVRLL